MSALSIKDVEASAARLRNELKAAQAVVADVTRRLQETESQLAAMKATALEKELDAKMPPPSQEDLRAHAARVAHVTKIAEDEVKKGNEVYTDTTLNIPFPSKDDSMELRWLAPDGKVHLIRLQVQPTDYNKAGSRRPDMAYFYAPEKPILPVCKDDIRIPHLPKRFPGTPQMGFYLYIKGSPVKYFSFRSWRDQLNNDLGTDVNRIDTSFVGPKKRIQVQGCHITFNGMEMGDR